MTEQAMSNQQKIVCDPDHCVPLADAKARIIIAEEAIQEHKAIHIRIFDKLDRIIFQNIAILVGIITILLGALVALAMRK